MDVNIKEKLDASMSYDSYAELMDKLVAEGKTTGPNQSEAMANYTKMNAKRMKRLDKTMKLSEDLIKEVQGLEQSYIWLVLTEAWCGDAAQIIPIFQKIVEETDNLELRLILRDEHPDLMDQFLTEGAKAIPKLISIKKDDLSIVNSWGPRPAPAQEMLMEFKANPSLTYSEFSLSLQKWYNQDKGETTQTELIPVLKALHQLYI